MLLVLALAGAPALAQIGSQNRLAISADASQLYFVSTLAPAGQTVSSYPLYLYKYVAGQLGLVYLPQPDLPHQTWNQLQGLNVSSDGSTVAVGMWSLPLLTMPVSGGYQELCLILTGHGSPSCAGDPVLSRNGRYVYAGSLLDLVQGTTVNVPLSNSSPVDAVANDGTVVGLTQTSPQLLAVWNSQTGVHTIPLPVGVQVAGGPTIDSTGTHVAVCDATSAAGAPCDIIELSSGNVSPIPTGFRLLQFSDDSSKIALFGTDPNNGRQSQVYLAKVDGSNLQQVTSEPFGVTQAGISGDASIVIAANGVGEYLQINVQQGARQLLFEAGPQLGSPGQPRYLSGGAPGSMVSLAGTGIAKEYAVAPPGVQLPTTLGGVQVLVDGTPVPLIEADGDSAVFQLPWELFPGSHQLEVSRDFSSPFALGNQVSLEVSTTDPWEIAGPFHQNWTPVTYASPAQAGEILHFYITGLGPVIGAIQTGEPTPSTTLFPLADMSNCHTSDPTLNLLFAGLAPGTVGVYQVDAQVTSLPSSYAPCRGF